MHLVFREGDAVYEVVLVPRFARAVAEKRTETSEKIESTIYTIRPDYDPVYAVVDVYEYEKPLSGEGAPILRTIKSCKKRLALVMNFLDTLVAHLRHIEGAEERVKQAWRNIREFADECDGDSRVS